MNFKDKAESLADKMNKLSEKFNIAEEMVVTGDDVVDYVKEKTDHITLYSEDLMPNEIVNLENMVHDFKYIRETLKETTENGRRVLSSVTLDLLDSDDDKRAALIMSFAELNKAVGDNMKLYMQSYKDISSTLLNLDKIKNNNQAEVKNVTNNLNITEAVNTSDLIKQLRGE
jgi:hypothetical protein